MARTYCTDTMSQAALFPATPLTWRGWARDGGTLIKLVSRNVLKVLTTWQRRAVERQRLADMSDRTLADIGLSRADLSVELEKPFWQA